MKKYWIYLQLIALVATPLMLLFLPTDYLDNKPSICLSRVLLGVECYGCGMGRGIMHLLHGDFEGAMIFNKLSLVVLPLLFFVWIKQIYRLSSQIFHFNTSKI